MQIRHIAVPVVLLWAASALFASDAVKVAKAAAEAAIASRTTPAYPPIAKQMRIEGAVELRAIVNNSGAVQSVQVVTGNPILAKAAVDALNKWRFNSSKIEGNPELWTADFTVSFKLQ